VVRAADEDPQVFTAWGRLVRGPLRWLTAPGNHYTMVREPNVAELVRALGGSGDPGPDDAGQRPGKCRTTIGPQ
jgi:hypothetical protein